MTYVFSDYELDEDLYELRRAGVSVKLEPQVFKVLTYLLRHRDRVVTKRELFEQLWPGEFVTESALTRCIVKARQAVHDDGTAQRVIKTVHRHGYRFVAAIEPHPYTAVADAPPGVRPPTHEAVALLSPSPMPQADTTRAGRLSREGERQQIRARLRAQRRPRQGGAGHGISRQWASRTGAQQNPPMTKSGAQRPQRPFL
jgi:DNA-binding winged helix-turn-helix (wHTH) protein